MKHPTDGQLIAIMSHTIGSIGQLIKSYEPTTPNEIDMLTLAEIKRIYFGYIQQIKWDD